MPEPEIVQEPKEPRRKERKQNVTIWQNPERKKKTHRKNEIYKKSQKEYVLNLKKPKTKQPVAAADQLGS